MQIEYLKYFSDIAETKSISQSALNCFISQQGLSRIVQVLEAEFGTVLLKKSGHRVELTSAGVDLNNLIQPILEQYDAIKTTFRMRSIHSQDSYSPNLFLYLGELTDRLFSIIQGSVYEEYTNLQVQAVSQQDIIEMVKDEDLPNKESSIFITCATRKSTDESLLQSQNLVFERFLHTEINVRVAKGAPLSYKESITLDELRKCPLAFRNSDAYAKGIRDHLMTNGVNPEFQAFLRSDDDEMVSEAIRAGYAVGFCTSLGSASVEAKGFTVVPLDKPMFLDFGFLYNPQAALSLEAQKCLSFLESRLKKIYYLPF